MNKKIFRSLIVAVVLVSFAGALGTVSAQQPTERMQDCIKIRTGFTLKIHDSFATPTAPPGGPNDVAFTSGMVVASKKLADGAFCDKATIVDTDVCVGSPTPSKLVCVVADYREYGLVAMMNTVYTVTNWVFIIMTIVAVLMIVFGGFTYITAAGDPAKAGKGKLILTYAIIGLAIALIAKIIPSLVRFILGV